ncbi:MAG: peptidoglycan-binding protein [Bryobacteraceae bacterium]|nr:peptidoglycan-binding protein [Bryobacteraceae bacterium]
MKLILVILVSAALSFGQARKITPSKTAKPTAIPKYTPKASSSKAAPIRPTTIAKTPYRAQMVKPARVAPASYRRSVYRAPVRVAYVQSPTPERYREIQQALADKGYLTTEVNGAWDQASIEALNRFKTDQKLKADGKLCSLSLIALGLGPKYEAINVDQLPANPIPADQQ